MQFSESVTNLPVKDASYRRRLRINNYNPETELTGRGGHLRTNESSADNHEPTTPDQP